MSAFQEDSSATGVNGDDQDDSAPDAGAAYVFLREQGAWSQEAYLKASNTDPHDGFGRSVAVWGDTVAIGAIGEASSAQGVNGLQSSNQNLLAGAAYVFTRVGTTWSQQAYVKASNTNTRDVFGSAVGLHEDTQDADEFGHGLALQDGRLAVGAWKEDSGATGVGGDEQDDSVSGAGAAYVIETNTATAAFRNAGSNPASYTAAEPVLGGTWSASVDVSSTGHAGAEVFGHLGTGHQVLPGGQVLLVSGARVLRLPLRSGPIATWAAPVPLDPSLAGRVLHSQAAQLGAIVPWALTNAVDLTVGY